MAKYYQLLLLLIAFVSTAFYSPDNNELNLYMISFDKIYKLNIDTGAGLLKISSYKIKDSLKHEKLDTIMHLNSTRKKTIDSILTTGKLPNGCYKFEFMETLGDSCYVVLHSPQSFEQLSRMKHLSVMTKEDMTKIYARAMKCVTGDEGSALLLFNFHINSFVYEAGYSPVFLLSDFHETFNKLDVTKE